MRGLLEAWVARLAECRLEQKAGYDQLASSHNRNPTILNVLIALTNNGKSEYTVKSFNKSLQHISRNADLNNSEAVKQFIANKKNVTNGTKKNLALAYDHYCRYYKIEWTMPKYRQEAKMIRIPTTEKLEMLIAKASRKLGLKLRISKETGLRPIEMCNLRVKDMDFDKRLIRPTTAKHGSARILKISQSLNTTLRTHVQAEDLDLNDKVFKGTAYNYGHAYRQMRNKLAKKLVDQSLRAIRLYDFRHYFATTLYAKTRDILYVMRQMGHKKIETTLIYTQLLHLEEDDAFICKTASNVKEATQLIENGFTYVTEMDDIKLFKKRK